MSSLASRPFIAGVVVLALSLPARAASSETPVFPQDPDAQANARALLENDNFAGAASVWERVLRETPETPQTHASRETMVLNAVDARLQAYERQLDANGDQEPLHLFTAHVTLRRYSRAIAEAYGGQRALSLPVQQRANSVASALADVEPNLPVRPSTVPVSAPDPPPPDAAPRSSHRNGNGLLVGGLSLGVLGMAVGLTMIPLGAALGRNAENIYSVSVINAANTSSPVQRALYLDDAHDAERAGRTANRVTIAGGVLSPLLLGGAAAMLVVGLQRKRSSVHHTPSLSPHYAGYEVSLQF